MDNPAQTSIACHQNVERHISSKKQLSTKTATLMQEVITMHKKFLKLYFPDAPDGVITCEKSKFALKYSHGKAIPSGFSHFYCYRVVLSTQKNFEGIFNISGRLGEVQPLKILLAARSFNLSGPPKVQTISSPCHLYCTPLVANTVKLLSNQYKCYKTDKDRVYFLGSVDFSAKMARCPQQQAWQKRSKHNK